MLRRVRNCRFIIIIIIIIIIITLVKYVLVCSFRHYDVPSFRNFWYKLVAS